MSKDYTSFREFYPFYLGEHQNRVCRGLHFVGTTVGLAILVTALYTQTWWAIPLALVQGYAWAWAGHFFFEKNRPATFSYPLYSFFGDWVMWKDILLGKIRI